MSDNESKKNPEPFLRALRATLFNKIIQSKKYGKFVCQDQDQADPQAEKEFFIHFENKPSKGVKVQHYQGGTSFQTMDYSIESAQALLVAVKELRKANESELQVDGHLQKTHYALTFDLHVVDIKLLHGMLYVAQQAKLNVKGFYLNGKPIDQRLVEEAWQFLRDNPTYNPLEPQARSATRLAIEGTKPNPLDELLRTSPRGSNSR